MYKLMIVDDFFVERENAVDILKKANLEIDIVGEYSNGQEAYEDIKNKQPDFILADVEMPKMNGLELGQLVKKNYPFIRIIYFSFYDKFEYIKKAMDIDAYSYILKPIVEEEMINAFEMIIKQKRLEYINQQNESRLKELLDKSKPLLIDKFKRDLFIGLFKQETAIWEGMEYLGLELDRSKFVALVVEIDGYDILAEKLNYEEKEIYSLRITQYIHGVISREKMLYVKIDDSHWGILLGSPLIDPAEISDRAYNLSDQLIEGLSLEKISISIGVSSIFSNIAEVHEMYLQAIHALKFKFNKGKGSIINFIDIQESIPNSEIDFSEMQMIIGMALNSGSFTHGWQYIDSLFEKINNNASSSSIKNMCFSFILLVQITLNDFGIAIEDVFGKEQIFWEKLIKFETIKDVKMWLKNTLAFVVDYINSKNKDQSKNIICEVKKYIDQNYSRSITVKAIADYFYYNPNYLNNIFKNETDETILDYITKKRIDMSKKMLVEHPEMKLYQISEAVGYKHDSYFRNIFKRYTGLNPKEFKERAIRK